MAGMLTAIMNFARVSFAGGADELRRLELGDQTVVIERSPKFILAVAITGKPPAEVQEEMRIFLERAERRYGPMDGPVDGGSDGVPRLAGDDEPTLPMRARNRLSSGGARRSTSSSLHGSTPVPPDDADRATRNDTLGDLTTTGLTGTHTSIRPADRRTARASAVTQSFLRPEFAPPQFT